MSQAPAKPILHTRVRACSTNPRTLAHAPARRNQSRRNGYRRSHMPLASYAPTNARPKQLASSSLLCRISSENEATPAAPYPSPSTISAPSHLQHVHQTSMLLILHLTRVAIIIIGVQPIPPHRPSIAALLSVIKSYSVSIRSEWNWSETPHQASNPARRLLYSFILATACRGKCPIDYGSWNVIRIAVLLLKLWGIAEG